jgi:hypothetical protein
MYCVCYICRRQYRVKPPFGDPDISHGLCEECLPGELLRMERETVAFRASTERHSVSERNRYFPKGLDGLNLG